jgi:hypothetical protein
LFYFNRRHTRFPARSLYRFLFKKAGALLVLFLREKSTEETFFLFLSLRQEKGTQRELKLKKVYSRICAENLT